MGHVKKYLDDLFYLAGCGLVLYGISLIGSIPAIITAGLLLIATGYLVGKGNEPLK